MTIDACTPGSWYAMTGDTGGIIDQAVVFSEHLTDGEPTFIADTMPVDDEVPLEQRKANAYLMAAARDLATAVRLLDAAICEGFDTPGARKDARAALLAGRAALAKANGPALSAADGSK